VQMTFLCAFIGICVFISFMLQGTVRVPAPCQYAHRLAYLVGQAIRKNPSTKLDELLYFL
jgi:aubergine-like protein